MAGAILNFGVFLKLFSFKLRRSPFWISKIFFHRVIYIQLNLHSIQENWAIWSGHFKTGDRFPQYSICINLIFDLFLNIWICCRENIWKQDKCQSNGHSGNLFLQKEWYGAKQIKPMLSKGKHQHRRNVTSHHFFDYFNFAKLLSQDSY